LESLGFMPRMDAEAYHLSMQCNIDKRGRLVRLWIGIFSILCGIGLIAATVIAAWATWFYLLAALMIAAGGFALFEASKKWCAVRAMGFRTPI